MKKILLLLLLCAFTLCGCNNTEDTVTQSHDIEEIKTEQQLSEDIANSVYQYLSEYSKGWIASTKKGISCYIQQDSVNITIRSTAPEIIGRLADESCDFLVEKINSSGYQNYSISYRYYTESNQDGMDDDSLVDWTTKNGKTGTLVDEKTSFLKLNATIDDVYEYFNDFAHDTDP